ncbi:MAG TPA: enoyl-CoA hydratase/isomerase family protein [Solirubrobacteraceae bacterium]|nr:enoyl-CoA hydratase/isomerase family protein [Solirubrobacteraceae bacterium]
MSAAAGIEQVGEVSVLSLSAPEGRFNPASLGAIAAVLDELEGSDAPGALVVTGEGKFFSNGLDLDWMGTAPPGGAAAVLNGVHALLARLLVFPTATVAAINGHAFAAGAMLALACDARVMREDRGYFCVPEVDLGLPFTPGMTALLKARLSPATAHEAMVTGRRYGAPEALAAGIVEATASSELLLEAAVARAAALTGKPRATVAAIKQGLYADALAALEAPAALPDSPS